jgi:hypothetical protein
MNADDMMAQLQAVIAETEQAERTTPRPSMQGCATRLLAAINRLSTPGSTYASRAAEIAQQPGKRPGWVAAELVGVASALRADIAAGYAQGVAELIHAEVFSDFLEMADELQTSGYKVAAAVIAGSVLEDHLRKLGVKSGLAIERQDGSPKKADTLNAELTAEGVYNGLVQKSVTAWLDLRNKAAHGHHDEFDHQHVAALVRDVREFLIRNPA